MPDLLLGHMLPRNFQYAEMSIDCAIGLYSFFDNTEMVECLKRAKQRGDQGPVIFRTTEDGTLTVDVEE